MRAWRIGAGLAVATIVVAAGLSRQQDEGGGPAAARAVAMPEGAVALRITVGAEGDDRAGLGGRLTVRDGRLAALEAETPGVRVEGGRWTVAETPAKKKAAPRGPIVLRATVESDGPALVAVDAGASSLSFGPGGLAIGEGVVQRGEPRLAADRVPLAVRLTMTPTDDDFPAAVRAPDGTVWCVYASYTHGTPLDERAVFNGEFDTLEPDGNGDRIMLVRFDGTNWSAPIPATDGGLDAWRPAVAVDEDGGVWAAWSERSGTDWQLKARRYDPSSSSFADPVLVAGGEGGAIGAVAATGGSGAWIAWQDWRDGSADVALARLTADGPGDPVRVSTGRANDWSPAVAADDRGAWVAWDTYEAGNYDVYIRRFDADGRPDGDRIAVANSPRFEARPFVAVDSRGRAWVAFEDAGEDWGKDFGPRFPGPQGTPLYHDRSVLVRVVEPGGLVQSVAEIPPSVPVRTHYDDTRIEATFDRRISLPRLTIDGDGRVWLLYRHHPDPGNPNGERWASYATRYDGDRWSPELELPGTVNLMDNRPALVPLPDGGFLAVASSDFRTGGSATAKVNDLFAIPVPDDTPAADPALAAVDPSVGGSGAAPLHPDEPADVKRMRSERIEAGGKTYLLLRGEFHRHTELSAHRDWDGLLEDMWRYGLDVAALDWLGPGDHDYAVGREYMWWLTQKQIDLYHRPLSFLPMFTYERSLPYPSGHRNVMFARRGVRALPAMTGQERRFGTPEEGSPDIKNLYAFLRHFGGICSSHTSATNMGTDWRDGDAEVEPVVEIFQGHRLNYEGPGAPLAPTGPDDAIQGYRPDGFVWNAFARGRRLGFQSSSDHVSTHISYAVVLAEDPTRQGIIDAFKQRHCYAANDNIVLDVRSGDHLMGDEWASSEPATIAVRAIGTRPIANLEIVRQLDGEVPRSVYHAEPVEAEVSLTWTDDDPRPGRTHMYYVRIQQADGRLAWASPIWVNLEP